MKKTHLGQFFTKKPFWKQKQIVDFINKYEFDFILDPFAGNGDLLKQFDINKKIKKVGMDIDKTLNQGWIQNDSLKKISFVKNSFVLTNPPYLSRSSSTRKKIHHNAFKTSRRSDLYQIALDKLLESGIPGIAILPESFINSNFEKNNIYSVTILIPNPFKDTETPVCIVCYDPNQEFSDTKIYKNESFLGTINDLLGESKTILKQKNRIQIKFNDEKGQLALVAYDSTSGRKIEFIKSRNLNYNKPQKISSRVVSKIKINKRVSKKLVDSLNSKLTKYRKATHDVFLTPFKGNDKFDNRRRRLDYSKARRIINSLDLVNM